MEHTAKHLSLTIPCDLYSKGLFTLRGVSGLAWEGQNPRRKIKCNHCDCFLVGGTQSAQGHTRLWDLSKAKL